jgi:hypothetical protein
LQRRHPAKRRRCLKKVVERWPGAEVPRQLFRHSREGGNPGGPTSARSLSAANHDPSPGVQPICLRLLGGRLDSRLRGSDESGSEAARLTRCCGLGNFLRTATAHSLSTSLCPRPSAGPPRLRARPPPGLISAPAPPSPSPWRGMAPSCGAGPGRPAPPAPAAHRSPHQPFAPGVVRDCGDAEPAPL